MLTFSSYADKTLAQSACLHALHKRLAELAASETPTLLLVSGGSALSVLPAAPEPHPALTIGMLDERFGADSTESNSIAFLATPFRENAAENGAEIYLPLTAASAAREAASDQYDAFLKEWRADHPSGIILATAGIGEDGHTAGILPLPDDKARFAELFEDADRWFVGYTAPGAFPERLTATVAFIQNELDEVFIYAVGSEKRDALLAAQENGPAHELPARIYHNMSRATAYTDQEIEL